MKLLEQKFDFDSNKENLLRLIERIKQNKSYHPLDINIIYSVLVGERKFTILFDDRLKKNWNNYFKSQYFVTDGVWSERRFNKEYKKIVSRTYNYYITITKNRHNILKFINSLSNLDKALNDLSNKTKECIAYKTHTILDMMVCHNDSLKVYYYNPDLKDNIEFVINKWASDNLIKLDNRLYNHGVDIKKNGDTDSYGMVLAKIILDKLLDVIKKEGNKYSDESYLEWLKQNINNIIKSVKIDYK